MYGKGAILCVAGRSVNYYNLLKSDPAIAIKS